MEKEKLFLDLELAPRSKKPRSRGITAIGDDGEPISWMREMLEALGEYVDCVHIMPFSVVMPWRLVEKRIKLFRDFQVNVVVTDPIFAIAYYQGKAEALLRTLRDMGVTHVQIDTRHIKLADGPDDKKLYEDEVRYTAMARELGLKIEGEVGQKWPEGDPARAGRGLLNIDAVVAEMKRLLSDGCELVYLESKVLHEIIGEYGEREEGTEQIRRVVEAVGLEHIVIEITGMLSFDARQCHRFWAVRNFGPEVNMGGGGSIAEVRYVEAIRRGVMFVGGPSRSTSRLWVKSLARGRGKAAQDWWKEDYPIDVSVLSK
ncbi:MAG: phosphosulfolactate synthase [Deltaproteobacteria bacterium]|nr:phosphosulfolactate synthase [Deltaproteobacteria bacterium]